MSGEKLGYHWCSGATTSGRRSLPSRFIVQMSDWVVVPAGGLVRR